MANPWTSALAAEARRRNAPVDPVWAAALRADKDRAHPLARDPKQRAAPTPRSKHWGKPVTDGAPLDRPEFVRGRETPSLGEYATSAGNTFTRAPGGALSFATEAIPQLAGDAYDYLQRSTPGEVLGDVGSGLKTYGRYAARNPGGAVADLLPVAGDIKGYAEMVDEAARARHSGDEATAAMLESYALPTVGLGLLPDAGAAVLGGKYLARGAAREAGDAAAEAAARELRGPPAPRAPPFIIDPRGPFYRVAREGVDPDTIPGAEGASLPKLRVILSNPQDNEPARAARKYTRAALGTEYDVNAPAPGTSLPKQAGIGAAFREAVEGSPEYKSALFERYGETMPEVVEQAGAQNYDQLTEAAYRQLAKETKDQFSAMPIRTAYHYGEGEYATPSAMLGDILGRGNLNVFRGGDPHPYLSDVDPDTGLSANEMFRATHDYYGHGTTGATFRPGGEEIAYGSHAQMMSPLAQLALLSETRGQNSLVNYSPLNADLSLRMAQARDELEQIKLSERMGGNFGAARWADRKAELNQSLREMGKETNYAPQTPLLLPPEYLDPYTKGGVPDWMRPLIQPRAASAPERAVHLSHTPGLTQTDPAFYGTGHRGDDWKTRSSRGDLANHTSFYLGPTGTVRPERMVADVSPHAYETQLSGLYDIAQDPEGLVKLAQAANLERMRKGVPDAHIGDLTRLVRDYGYSGYRNPDFIGQGAANVLGPVEGLRAIERGELGYAAGGIVEGHGG